MKRFRSLSKRWLIVLLLSLTMLGTVGDYTSVLASDLPTGQSITMSPSSSELSIPPGGSTKNSFSVINQGTVSYSFNVYAKPYSVRGEEYDPDFTPLPGTTDASRWVELTTTGSQSLLARSSVDIDYQVKVPAATAPGGYYAVLFAQAQPKSAAAGVSVYSRVGNILYITVQGPVQQKGSLTGSALPLIKIGSSLPIDVKATNSGGLHFVTDVSMTAVSALSHHTAFQAKLERYVLPQTTRRIYTVWPSLPPIGLYKISRSATIAGHNQVLPSRWVLVVRPEALLIIIFTIVGLVLLWLSVGRRRSVHHKPVKRQV